MVCGLTNMDIHQFIFWGMFGLTVELFFTAITELITKKNLNLMGHSSIWMFPIYTFGQWEKNIGYPTSNLGVRI